MLEDEVDEKYFLSDKMIKYIVANNEKWTGNNNKSLVNKSIASTINIGEGTRRCDASNYIVDGLPEDTDIKEAVRLGGVFDKDGVKHQAGSIWDINGISPTLDTMQGGYRQPCILIKEATKKGYAVAEEGDGVYLNRPHQKRGVVQKGMIQTIKCNGNDLGVVVLGNYSPSGHNASRVVDANGLSPAVMENHGTVTATVVSAAQRKRENGQEIEVSEREVANAITTVSKDSMVAIKVKDKADNEIPLYTKYKKLVETVEQNEMPLGEVKHMDLYNRNLTENCGTLTDPKHNNNSLWDGLRIRKLTPKECFRLMAFEDCDIDCLIDNKISNTQLYKMAGNSIVVDVLKYIFKELFKVINIPYEVFERKDEFMKKTKLTINGYLLDRMFNIEKLVNNEPDLFNELCEKYPAEEGINWIEVGKKGKPIKKVVETPKVEEEPKQEFPEDFKPLYNVGEKLAISYGNGDKKENITITNIKLNDDKKYYYKYLVDETGEIKEMAEDWLVDHEVIGKAA